MDEALIERPSGAFAGHRSLLIGSPAPSFTTRTTMGDRSLQFYRGRWLVFFSHPADFTPVCTSEFVAFAKAHPKFQRIGCDLLALSVDSLFAHIAWVRSIQEKFDVSVQFPIAEDPSLVIAMAYGMIHPDASNAATVRATFVIDPLGIVRALVWYPMSTGRSVTEVLRLVQALQVSDKEGASTPEGWQVGERLVEPTPLTVDAAAEPGGEAFDWYYRIRSV
jgi:peroxiredoxin 2/4